MKRIIACALCLALLWASAAWAEDPARTDIAALMARQVSSNCVLRAQLTAELSEQTPFFASDALWEALRGLCAGTSLEGTYIFSRAGQTLGNSQLSLYAKRGEDTLSTLRFSGRGEEWQIFGDVTAGEIWTLPRQTDLLLRDKYLTLSGWGGVLLRGLGAMEAALSAPETGEWPALYRLGTLIATQDETWRQAFDIALKKYTDQISAWMQQQAKVYLVRGADGSLTTGSEIHADSATLADEALALLRLFYSDSVMLSLLRPLMTQLEAEAYLEPGMQLLFESVLHSMTLPGEFILDRRGGADGDMERLAASFPLAAGVTLHWEQAGGVNILRLETPAFTAEISLQGAPETGLSGAFSYKGGGQTVSGKYQLTASLGQVYEDEDSSGRSRRQRGSVSLIVTPDAGQTFPAQSLTLEISARSGLQTDQSAHWNLDIDWQELGGGAYAHIAVKTRTGAPIQQIEPEALPAVDWLALNDSQRQARLNRAKELLTEKLTAK